MNKEALPLPKVFICGGSVIPGPRGTVCPNPVHDWPTPAGMLDAFDVAGHRLNNGWQNTRCPDCGLYGWTPGHHQCPDCAVPINGGTQ